MTSSVTPKLLSPPLSPFSEPELPVVATNDLGMIADNEHSPGKVATRPAVRAVKKRKATGTRRKITYVSKHFVTAKPKHGLGDGAINKEAEPVKQELHQTEVVDGQIKQEPTKVPEGSTSGPRIYYGLNVDDLSSDSSLSDVPDDIGPDPFLEKDELPSRVQAVKVKKVRLPTTSPYFPAPHRHRHRPTFLSTLPFPPLAAEKFGLMQERLAHDPFRLLIATIFLNKTPGERAMPIFYQLMERYPTPADLASADVSDITSIIYVLGFQNQRARKCVEMAKGWIARPPEQGKRYRKHNYPVKGDGRDVKPDEVLGDGDERVAWEISHLPGLGPYSHDSWRMFCRDELRAKATDWNGVGALEGDSFEPEWKRVVPLDKELRAWLTWMWLKEGWVWNKETGQRTKASEELMSMARGGGIVVEEKDSAHLTVKQVGEEKLDILKDNKKLEQPAGDFLPRGLNV